MNKKVLLQSTVLALGLEGALQAQTWDYGAATQNWTDALNWNPDGVPTAGATINTATAGQTPIITTAVALNGADTFIGNGAAGTLDINSGGSLNTSTKWIFIGTNAGGNGTLNVNSGGSLTSDNDVRVGRFGGSQGHLNVNGGSVIVDSIVNENAGANTFAFSNGATVTTLNGTGLSNLTLTNITGSISLQGGDQSLAAGNHDIASGGNFDTSGQLFIGNGVTSALTVDAGAGSVNAGSWMPVGIGTGGNGTLNLNSGTINATDVSGTAFTTVGASNNAVGVINQNGGTFNQGGAGIVLGESGTGSGTYNLNAGDLNTKRIWNNGGTTSGTLNLNGGTLHAIADEADFISANVTTNVQAGGANIDTNGFNVTTGANLAGAGALDKQGAGSLNLTGAGNSVDTAAVSAGTLYISGALTTANGTSVASGATIGAGDLDGGAITGDLYLALGSMIDLTNGLLTLDSGTVSFGGFGFGDIVGFDVNTADIGTYTILDGSFTLDSSNISNFGLANALDLGGGKSAYFQAGSLSVVVIPEPSAALLGGLGVLALLRRRRS